MQPSFPLNERCILRNAALPATVVDPEAGLLSNDEGFFQADLLLSGGKIARIGPSLKVDAPSFDLRGGQVWPTCVELHSHLDKGHTLPRAKNPDGTLRGAIDAVRVDRLANWSAEDVERRFDFSLRCAYAHGTSAIRTHIDSYHPQAAISWPVLRRMRDRWAGRIALQGVCMTLLDAYEGEAGRQLADLVLDSGGILGGVTFSARSTPDEAAQAMAVGLDRLFGLAAERGLDVDLHVDETPELEPNTLKAVALSVLRTGFRGRVVCGHCCSRALRTPEDARETIALVKEAGLAIVTLPLVNLHLQGRRSSETPRWRGVTLVRELADAGVPIAASSDNCRDPLYAFGDFDAIEVFRDTVKICQLDLDGARWIPLVTRTPAQIMRLPEGGTISAGATADLILFRARTLSELLARPQSDRIVLRAGQPIDTALPDYSELEAAQ